MSDSVDARRYRALRKFLAVARDEPGDWTCWLDLACVPYRSRTTDPDELADNLAQALEDRGILAAPAAAQPQGAHDE